MTVFGWIALALLIGYWILLFVRGLPQSYIIPGIITAVLGGLAIWSAMAPVPVMGGRRR